MCIFPSLARSPTRPLLRVNRFMFAHTLTEPPQLDRGVPPLSGKSFRHPADWILPTMLLCADAPSVRGQGGRGQLEFDRVFLRDVEIHGDRALGRGHDETDVVSQLIMVWNMVESRSWLVCVRE